MPRLTDPLSDAELGRRRFVRYWDETHWGPFSVLGPRWGPGLSLYLFVLPSSAGAWLRRLLSDLGLFRSQSSSGVAKGLKHLSDVMKKQGVLLSGYWRFAVNLETLGGYRAPLPMSTFIPELRQWATGDIIHAFPTGSRSSEALFIKHFRSGIRDFLNLAPSVRSANQKALTLDEFVSDPSNWTSDGSTQYKGKVQVQADGKLVSLTTNKTTTGLLLDPEYVRKAILDPHVQTLRPIEKLESGKVRAVVNADDTIYLKMAFVSNWLERALKGHPQTTLFMTSEQRMDMWQRLSAGTHLRTTKIPLDQSHFDWQPNKRMLAACIAEIKRFVAENATVDRSTLLRTIDSINYTLVETTGKIVVADDGLLVSIPVEKGVMSGWRWTALIDTLCNVGELRAASELCATWGLPNPVSSFVAQGDDDQVTSPSFSHATALACAYSAMNFEINPGKFFIDTTRDEFLRLVPLRDRIIGYPSRAINNLLWRNPINPDPLPGELSIKAQLAQWTLLINRGCDMDKCLKLMLIDMGNRNKIGRQDLIDYLLTPASYGGCGLVGTPLLRSRNLSLSQSKVDRVFSVVSKLPGLSRVQDSATRLGIPQEVVESSVKQVLPLTKLRGSVSDYKVAEVVPGITKIVEPIDMHVPRAYVMSDAVPRFLHSHYTRLLVRNRQYDILLKYCDPDVLPYFRQFQSRMTKACFDQWLLGNLPLNAPVVVGYSPEQVSVLFSKLVNSVLLSVTHHMKVTLNYFRAAVACCVPRLKLMLAQQVPLSG